MANPTWFDAKVYMANKLAQLVATDPKGAWTEGKLIKAMEDAGFKGTEGAFRHFEMYGMDENVSPSADFDVNYYLAAKAEQLNKEMPGSSWTPNKVMEAIKAAGMNSAWEHFDKYGSQEGVATSATFDTAKYFIEKTTLMNETKEGGRSNWTISEVKAAFEANGFSALEHYNLFGKDEFKAAGKDVAALVKPTISPSLDPNYDPNTGVQTYSTLQDALDAQKAGTLAAKYAIGGTFDTTVLVTVAQQAGMEALIAGAAKAPSGRVSYFLNDTVEGIASATTTVLMNSKNGYDITDTLDNVVTGDDGLVNNAVTAKATIAFAAKNGDPAVVNKVNFADIKGNAADDDDDATITIAHADKDTNKGNAIVHIDASTETQDSTKSFDLSAVFEADESVTFDYTGSDKVDMITVHDNGGVIATGGGNDAVIVHLSTGDVALAPTSPLKVNLGAGNDTLTINVHSNDLDIPADNANMVLDGGDGTNDTLAFIVDIGATSARSIDFMSDKQIVNIETIDLSGVNFVQTGTENNFVLSLANQTENFTINAGISDPEDINNINELKIIGSQGNDTINLEPANGKPDTVHHIIQYGPTNGSTAQADAISGFVWGANGDTIRVKALLGDTAANAIGAIKDITSGGLNMTTDNDHAAYITAASETLTAEMFTTATNKITVEAGKYFFVVDSKDDTNDTANMYFVTAGDGGVVTQNDIVLLGTVNEATAIDASNFE